ncbi:MAG: restriction endonuclease [Candidatus Brocadiaceae bacterium]|nr:restriction endonuclease [Candidatus Brocadiaceae bacterium]
MAIPDYQKIMLPLLKFSSDQQEHSLREAIDNLADYFDLSDEERRELLSSGQQTIFANRVGWARTYLKKATLFESTRRGYFRITERGINVLKENPQEINAKFLYQFDEFKKFLTIKRKTPEQDKEIEEEKTPEETLESAYQNLRDNLANDLIQQIKLSPPSLFEKIVVELLVRMGYGGSLKDAGKAIGRSGDEGIDGIIKEDRLGLDIIYIQAKRWENTVSRPEIQKFAGALQGQRARKGIFITTSSFSREAQDYVSRIDSKIVLIDGEQLAQFMIDHNIGVTSISAYEIKKIDSDYFTEE